MKQTEFAIFSTYWIVASVLGILGNIFVIRLTQKYPAHIGISMTTLEFLKHLAFTDLAYSLTFLAIVCNDLYLIELGKLDFSNLYLNYPFEYLYFTTFNKLTAIPNAIAYSISIVLILGISVHRLYIIMKPLKASQITPKSVHVISGVSLGLFVVFHVSKNITNFSDTTCGMRKVFGIFDLCPNEEGVTLLFLENTSVFDQIGLLLTLVFPVIYCMQVSLNIAQLVYTVQFSLQKQRSARRPLVTTLSVAAVFVASWTPYIVWICYMFYLRALIESHKPLPANAIATARLIEFIDCTIYCFSLYCNPIIYTLTIKKFKTASKRLLLRWVRKDVSSLSARSS